MNQRADYSYNSSVHDDVSPRFKVIRLSDLLRKDFPETTWIVESLIPAASIVVLAASPGSFKTWLTLSVAVSVARGSPLWEEFRTAQTNVLVINVEESEGSLKRRFTKLGAGADPVYILAIPDYQLAADGDETLAFAKDRGIGLIVFDTLRGIHGADENDSSAMQHVFSLFKYFKAAGISVFVTQHTRKDGGSRPALDAIRGSSAIAAAADVIMTVQRHRNAYLEIRQAKNKEAPEVTPFQLFIANGQARLRFVYGRGGAGEDTNIKQAFREGLLELLADEPDPLYQQEAFARLRARGIKGSYNPFIAAVQELVAEHAVVQSKAKGRGNRQFISLKVPPDGKVIDDGMAA